MLKENSRGKLDPTPPLGGYKNVKILKNYLSFFNQFPPTHGCMSFMDVKMNYINTIKNEIKEVSKSYIDNRG